MILPDLLRNLYDVDWIIADKIEVMRGLPASIYGGGGAAGVLNITTQDKGISHDGGMLFVSFGSNNFLKKLCAGGWIQITQCPYRI